MKALTLALFACSAQAQTMMPPSDTDLHASYCVAALQNDIKWAEAALAQVAPQQSTDAYANKIIASAKLTLATSQPALRRVQQYLLPKLLYLEPMGLLLANKAAEDDIARIAALVNTCTGDAALDPTCYSTNMPDLHVIQEKLQACRDLSWLPF
jgi:hypothetical protein